MGLPAVFRYGRTSCRLYTPRVSVPISDWILTQGAFQAVLDKDRFLSAQLLADRTLNESLGTVPVSENPVIAPYREFGEEQNPFCSWLVATF